MKNSSAGAGSKPRTNQQVFRLAITSGYYNETKEIGSERDEENSSRYMCLSIQHMLIAGVITETEYQNTRKSIRTFLDYLSEDSEDSRNWGNYRAHTLKGALLLRICYLYLTSQDLKHIYWNWNTRHRRVERLIAWASREKEFDEREAGLI